MLPPPPAGCAGALCPCRAPYLATRALPLPQVGSDVLDQPLESCTTDGITHPELYNLDGVAYESVVIGLQPIITSA